MISIIITMISW